VSTSGIITTIAGNGSGGFAGDGGSATSASLDHPLGVAVDTSGGLFVADEFNNRIRKVSASGIISTVAGDGSYRFYGDGGPATSASLAYPSGVAVDVAGNLFIADSINARVRKVSASGIITTIAGSARDGFSGDGGPATSASLFQPRGVAPDTSGNLFIADYGNDRIRKVSSSGIITTVAGNEGFGFSGDGGLATSASLSAPSGVAADMSGNLFIADSGNNRIRKVSASGIVTTIAGSGSHGFSGDGGPATSASFWGPPSIAVDPSGNLFLADIINQRIRKVSVSGIITTVAGNGNQGFSGDGGPAISASFYNPGAVAADASGNLFISDNMNQRIRKVSASGIITTVAGNGTQGFSGDGGPATLASLYRPGGVAVDASGNLFIADSFNQRIRKVSTNGIVTTIAGNGNQGFSGDGGPATSASLAYPSGIAVDASGNLYIGDYINNRVREVLASAYSTPPPSITSGAVVPVDSTVATIQPGEWVSIYGTNLASSTVTWNGDFPTSLGGTSVAINGNAAFLSFVSPTQIILQAPDDTATGPVPVVVTTASGTATSTVTLAQFAPSFLLLDSTHVAGIILRSDGSGAYGGGAYDIIGPTGNSLGYPTVAAKAGDTIELFAIGLGPTDPAVPAGQAFSGVAPAINPVNVLINNVGLTPTLAALSTSDFSLVATVAGVQTLSALSSAGIYQINLTIPASLGTGDVSLVATVGESQTQSGVVISLQSAVIFNNITGLCSPYTNTQLRCGYLPISGPAGDANAPVSNAAQFSSSAGGLATDARVIVVQNKSFGPSYGLFNVAIYSDGGGVPGVPISQTVMNLAAPDCCDAAIITASFSQPVSLQAGAPYWLVLTPANTNSYVAWVIGGSSLLPAASTTSTDASGTWTPNHAAVQFAIDGLTTGGAARPSVTVSPAMADRLIQLQ